MSTASSTTCFFVGVDPAGVRWHVFMPTALPSVGSAEAMQKELLLGAQHMSGAPRAHRLVIWESLFSSSSAAYPCLLFASLFPSSLLSAPSSASGEGQGQALRTRCIPDHRERLWPYRLWPCGVILDELSSLHKCHTAAGDVAALPQS